MYELCAFFQLHHSEKSSGCRGENIFQVKKSLLALQLHCNIYKKAQMKAQIWKKKLYPPCCLPWLSHNIVAGSSKKSVLLQEFLWWCVVSLIKVIAICFSSIHQSLKLMSKFVSSTVSDWLAHQFPPISPFHCNLSKASPPSVMLHVSSAVCLVSLSQKAVQSLSGKQWGPLTTADSGLRLPRAIHKMESPTECCTSVCVFADVVMMGLYSFNMYSTLL